MSILGDITSELMYVASFIIAIVVIYSALYGDGAFTNKELEERLKGR